MDQPSGRPSYNPTPSMPTPASRESRTEHVMNANIGQSVQIKGELTGNEDLTVDGRIDGKINLKDHHLTVGAHGKIQAEVHAKSVLVNGEVIGNVWADDKVEISPSGTVHGDICAPRVALADGSSFKGAIDMSRKPTTSKTTPASSAAAQTVKLAASGVES
jgi:cytoskeletal protein CcmA (bactofilin family)